MWSVARGNGEGRSIDIYQVFAEFFREDAKKRTTRPTMEIKTLLRELLHDEDMGRREMERSKSFVSEIINMINRQHETFLKKSNSLGLDSLKQAFQQDTTFWSSCADPNDALPAERRRSRKQCHRKVKSIQSTKGGRKTPDCAPD